MLVMRFDTLDDGSLPKNLTLSKRRFLTSWNGLLKIRPFDHSPFQKEIKMIFVKIPLQTTLYSQ
jgi:hypothetical protein